ncbi:hypothetical protein ACHHYP_20508 [Achlya hypogyna]|uniref:Reverse transcriptase zinc-binding domain-containing protein n=1 Tax=Achlya hypogyna TaxID=1202772 RepID=A0A1V9ZHN3_ACHHY|nr:hypothetical protein ACHHYP_20508 [Achlya hypogyna]
MSRSVAELRLPEAILPKYADFVYKVALRAVKFRVRFHWLPRTQQDCLFCSKRETCDNFFVACDYIKDI